VKWWWVGSVASWWDRGRREEFGHELEKNKHQQRARRRCHPSPFNSAADHTSRPPLPPPSLSVSTSFLSTSGGGRERRPAASCSIAPRLLTWFSERGVESLALRGKEPRPSGLAVFHLFLFLPLFVCRSHPSRLESVRVWLSERFLFLLLRSSSGLLRSRPVTLLVDG
jgi:hypothetical protein